MTARTFTSDGPHLLVGRDLSSDAPPGNLLLAVPASLIGSITVSTATRESWPEGRPNRAGVRMDIELRIDGVRAAGPWTLWTGDTDPSCQDIPFVVARIEAGTHVVEAWFDVTELPDVVTLSNCVLNFCSAPIPS